jgi:endonuclease III
MKDSKEYSKKVQKFYRSLKSKHRKADAVSYEEPLEALVYAIVSENMSQKSARSAVKRFGECFVDLNDLRVSRAEEIIEALGEDTSATRETAGRLTKVLRWIFNEYHKVSLDGLKKMGKRPARQALEKIEGLSRFAVDYCMLTALGAHAIPLTARMTEYLKSQELVHPEADEEQIEGFLGKQISARNGYEFYSLVRETSESGRGKAKKKTKTKAKTKTKPQTGGKTKTAKTTTRKTKTPKTSKAKRKK